MSRRRADRAIKNAYDDRASYNAFLINYYRRARRSESLIEFFHTRAHTYIYICGIIELDAYFTTNVIDVLLSLAMDMKYKGLIKVLTY